MQRGSAGDSLGTGAEGRRRVGDGWLDGAVGRDGAGKGTVGQVAGEKNIHARGDAEFSFSRR